MRPSLVAALAELASVGRDFVAVARDGVAELRGLREALAERRDDDGAAGGPVMGREAIAEAWGVSPSTVDEVIGACPPDQRPPSIGTQRKRYWFASAEAARAWFAEAQAAPVPTARRTAPKKSPRRPTTGPAPAIDLRRVAREAIAAREGRTP